MNVSEQFEIWKSNPYFGKETREELCALENDPQEVNERFYRDLEFGTAGLRGVMGAGTNRMNVFVVRRASTAIAELIVSLGDGAVKKGVAVSYDTRNNSWLFAKEAASVFAGYGIRTRIFRETAPVPVLSFTVISGGFQAGIMITASHNPKEYNGYKVYWSDGAQIGAELAEEITGRISALRDFTKVRAFSFDMFLRMGKIQFMGPEIKKNYFGVLRNVLVDLDLMQEKGEEFGLVYTPLHGSGAKWFRDFCREANLKNYHIVPEQFEPDGNFPTVPVPNPENKAAFVIASELAKKTDADLIIANDPDADRMGACVKDRNGEYKIITGNQIGSLMMLYILESNRRRGTMPEKPFAVSTVVSTDLAPMIARDNGIEFIQVLTGFKYIGEQVNLREPRGEKFVLGFEESYGFLTDSYARDKDGIAAALILYEMGLYYKIYEKKTLLDVLEEIYRKYGYFCECQQSLELKGAAGLEKTAHLMTALRERGADVVPSRILSVTDLLQGTERNVETGEVTKLDLPASNVLKYRLENGWFAIRPSGTEPKVKFYFGMHDGNSVENAEKAAAAVREEILSAAKEIVGD